jgi:FkbM family methyltransferase
MHNFVKARLKEFMSHISIKRVEDIVLVLLSFPHLAFTFRLLKASKAQLSQDLFVARVLKLWHSEAPKGFFVEFGATNGRDLSNTWALEKKFGWHGILVEPGKSWHDQLKSNRSCNIDYRCVYSESGVSLRFTDYLNPEYSTVEGFGTEDAHSSLRVNPSIYAVTTIKLVDLLDQYSAPDVIDYLSIDTEGSEYEILKAMDFDRYSFRVITVEHNYTAERLKIFELLSRNGYKRMFTFLSQQDDWYILPTIL